MSHLIIYSAVDEHSANVSSREVAPKNQIIVFHTRYFRHLPGIVHFFMACNRTVRANLRNILNEHILYFVHHLHSAVASIFTESDHIMKEKGMHLSYNVTEIL